MFDLQAFLQAESRRSLGEAIRQTLGSSLGARSFLLVGGAPARSGRISPIVVAADFPQSVMAQLHANPLCENIPLMNEWLQHERPICQQLDKMRSRALSPAVNQMRPALLGQLGHHLLGCTCWGGAGTARQGQQGHRNRANAGGKLHTGVTPCFNCFEQTGLMAAAQAGPGLSCGRAARC